MCIVFFFKQKTAYEMRISDWSSDVCSSDLCVDTPLLMETLATIADSSKAVGLDDIINSLVSVVPLGRLAQAQEIANAILFLASRSEEHTSELQSLMRISYAVFCLTKKIQKHKIQIQHQ